MSQVILQLLNGLVVGSVLALVASGLALQFGVMNIVNFAQGDFYMAGAYVLWLTTTHSGNYLLGIVAGTATVAVGLGLVLAGMAWPLLEKSQALVLLATLGLSLIMEQLATNVFGGDTKLILPPIHAVVTIGSIRYPVYDLAIVAVALGVLIAGFLWLRYTRYGIWLRAVAENRSMAAVLGVPVPRVYILGFMVTSGLAGLAGCMLAPVTSVSPTVGADIILNAFIIVVAGGLGNFRGAALVALLFGEVQSLGSLAIPPIEVQLILFALVIVLLLLRSRRRVVLNQAVTVAPQPQRSVSAASVAGVGMGRRRWGLVRIALITAVVAALVIVPPVFSGFLARSLAGYLIFGLLALSVALIAGQGWLFNIGVGATFGSASYAVALLSHYQTVNPWVLMFGALAVGVLVSVLFGIFAILSAGVDYLMLTFLTSLAFAEIPMVSQSVIGGDNGLGVTGGLAVSFGINPLQGVGFYWFVLGVTAVCALLSWFALSSQAGRAVRAVGLNPLRAAAMGYNVSTYRMALTLFSGFIAAVGGWLYALQTDFVFQGLLGLGNSLNGLVYALIGGAESIVGPFLGAAGLRYVSEVFGQASTESPIYVGIVLLLVVYFVPDGLAGVWRWLAARGRKSVPSSLLPESLKPLPD